MNIAEAKDFLFWCKENGIFHVEMGDLKADIAIKPEAPAKPTDENSFNHIPSFTVDGIPQEFTTTPFDVSGFQDINHEE
jgi:hypothetical protein